MATLTPAEQVASRDGRLAAEVELPSGRAKRWGPDEASTADILAGLQFTTSDPGGFKDSNFGLARDVDRQWEDLNLLLPLHIYGAGRSTAWEGRLQERPGRHGVEDQITPGAVGWQAHLADRPFQEIYVDRDISHWVEPSLGARLGALSVGISEDGCAVTAASGPSGEQAVSFAYSSLRKGYRGGLRVYYGNGVDIGAINYTFTGAFADVQFVDEARLGTVEVSGDRGTQNLSPAVGPISTGFFASAPGAKYALIYTARNSPEVIEPWNFAHTWKEPIIRGNSGIPMQFDGVNYSTLGVLASDVIANIVRRFAPKLNFTTGVGGSIQPTSFVLKQCAFTTPIKPADAITAVNAYHQYSWGVEDGRRFFFRPTSTYRKRWRIRRSRGDGVELLGPQADAAVNGVVVNFTDPGGTSRTVGPPEYTTAYTTSSALVDARPTNPVNIVGGGQKWGELTLGFVTDAIGAIQIGAMWLANQLNNAASRGSVQVTGVVEDEHGAYWPSWAMRAGDSATVVDGDNVERRIIETTYSADSRQVNCNLDATPHQLEAIMERMGIAVAGL